MKEVKDFCKKYNLTEAQFFGMEVVVGDLDLHSVTSIPSGFNPTVGGDLYLSSATSIPSGFNPTVRGDLYLSSATSIPSGFNPTVRGYLDLSSATTIPSGFNPTVGGGLYLRSVTTIPSGFNPTVGGYLYLRSVTSIPRGFNPTVGGYLYWDNGKSKYIGKMFFVNPYFKASILPVLLLSGDMENGLIKNYIVKKWGTKNIAEVIDKRNSMYLGYFSSENEKVNYFIDLKGELMVDNVMQTINDKQ